MIKEAWGGFGGRLSALGKQYEDAMLLAILERIAWRINPLTISEFLRLTPTQMRNVELQDEQPESDNASEMAAGQGPRRMRTTANEPVERKGTFLTDTLWAIEWRERDICDGCKVNSRERNGGENEHEV